jgi:serine/threonine-protein kinase RsbW
MSRTKGDGAGCVRLSFPADVEFLPLANAVVEQALRLTGADEESEMGAANAVLEAVTNAAQYGGAGTEVDLRIEVCTGRLDVTVEDRGPGFAPVVEACRAPAPGAIAERGRGLQIMKAVMDEVRFEARPGGGTCARLTKRFS